jgi:small subunit ribosomal protein S1
MAINSISQPDPPLPDDGWWESVLAEDQAECLSTKTPGVAEAPGTNPRVDWENALRLFGDDGIIVLRVTGYNRGGLLVEGERMEGFIPCSHLVNLPHHSDEEKRREECLSTYLGSQLSLKIIECEPEEDRLVFSERAALAGAGRRKEIFETLRAGQTVSGDVTNITEFGVFVDLGGVEGLIHISELSWGRVAHPNQVLQVGQMVTAIVLDVFPERCRIALSLKRLTENPWLTAEAHFPVDSIVPAVISAIVPFGAFARLEGGLEGLIHTSEIPLPGHVALNAFLVPGQTIQARVIQVDARRQRLGLSMKL